MSRIDLSEMSEWDGTQSPPNLSLRDVPAVPFVTRTWRPGDRCLVGECAGCGRILISAVDIEFRGRVWNGARMEARNVLHCARCFTFPKARRRRG